MTQPLPPELVRRRHGLADVIAAEQQQVAVGADACGFTCLCHGGIACLRVAHPHDPRHDWGDGRPLGNVVPHVGLNPGGDLVQWVCADPQQQAMTAQDHAQVAQQARETHTRALVDGLDLDTLRAIVAAKEATG